MKTNLPAISIYLLSPNEVVNTPLTELTCAPFEELQAGFATQLNTRHSLVSDPDAAEIVLAPVQLNAYGRCFELLRSSFFYRRHGAKLIVYSIDSNQFPALRGMYPSIAGRWVRGGWALPAHYVSSHYTKFEFRPDELCEKDILFSFVGSSRTHPVREKIFHWRHPELVAIDSSPKTEREFWWEKPNKADFWKSFREITLRSRFVVCPRGISPSSVRVFETMEAGAVPIIVADEMELPLGPDWPAFSLRVAERELDTIPELVERHRDRAAAMGRAARQAWDTYFSPEATVGTVVGWAQQLLAHSHRRPLALQWAENTRPQLLKSKLRHALVRTRS